jgi:hypothetical protein
MRKVKSIRIGDTSVGSSPELQQICLDTGIKRVKWTKQEEAKFNEAVKKFGKDYISIYKYIGTKTLIQVQKYANRYMSGKKLFGREDEVIRIFNDAKTYRRKSVKWSEKDIKKIQETILKDGKITNLELGKLVGRDGLQVGVLIRSIRSGKRPALPGLM